MVALVEAEFFLEPQELGFVARLAKDESETGVFHEIGEDEDEVEREESDEHIQDGDLIVPVEGAVDIKPLADGEEYHEEEDEDCH